MAFRGGDRGGWRAGGGDEHAFRGGEFHGDVGFRGGERTFGFRGGEHTFGFRGGERTFVPDRSYYRGGYAFAPRTYGYRYGGYAFRDHPRFYFYNSFFGRPRFVRSGLSIGFVLGAYPSYGYRYYDPYCGRYFNDLTFYDEHSDEYGHPPVVEVLHYGEPVASAVFDGGRLVVEDCY